VYVIMSFIRQKLRKLTKIFSRRHARQETVDVCAKLAVAVETLQVGRLEWEMDTPAEGLEWEVEWEQELDLAEIKLSVPDEAEGEQDTIGLIEAWTWTEEEGPVWVSLADAWRILGMHG
jgi:hypothetical protein